jgi:uncharacterized protein YndB with AHSA1/START domain
MASNHVYIDAPPEAVWQVLADARSYAHWVVGSSQVRRVEGRWPARGSVFHHTQGVGPLGLRDTTAVIESRKPSRLVLEVRMRPVFVARVELSLAPHGEGTWLTIRESPFGGLAGRFAGPLLEPLIAFRNVESLRRLRRQAERRAAAAG